MGDPYTFGFPRRTRCVDHIGNLLVERGVVKLRDVLRSANYSMPTWRLNPKSALELLDVKVFTAKQNGDPQISDHIFTARQRIVRVEGNVGRTNFMDGKKSCHLIDRSGKAIANNGTRGNTSLAKPVTPGVDSIEQAQPIDTATAGFLDSEIVRFRRPDASNLTRQGPVSKFRGRVRQSHDEVLSAAYGRGFTWLANKPRQFRKIL